MSLGKKLKQLRIERGWKQAELAEKIDIRQKQISAYERGAYHPSTEIVTLLAQWHKNSFPLRSRWQSPAFSSFSCYFFIQNGLFSHLMVLNTQYIDRYVPCNYKGRL